jgi:hypothetical protein
MSVYLCKIAAVSESKCSATAESTLGELEGPGADAGPVILVGERLLVAQAMQLLMRLDRELVQAPGSIQSLVQASDARPLKGRLAPSKTLGKDPAHLPQIL